MRRQLHSALITAILAAALSSLRVSAQVLGEPPIPATEIERIELVARQALDAGDITKSQYRKTIDALHSKPCKVVDRTLTSTQMSKLAPIIAEQYGWDDVQLLESFKLGKWQIIHLDNHVTDDPYIFFSDIRGKKEIRGVFGGGAGIFENEDILNWVVKEIPNTPKQLARCFAWHVTFNTN